MTDQPKAKDSAPKGTAASSDSPPVLPPITTDPPETASDHPKGSIAPLEQPPDALKMTDMGPSNDAEAPTSNAPPSGTQPPAGNDLPTSGDAPASNTSSSQPRFQASTSDKGKGPEQPPTPPAKNDEPQGTAKNNKSQGAAKGSQPQGEAKNNQSEGEAKGNQPQDTAKDNGPQGATTNNQPQDTAIGEATDDTPAAAPSARADGLPVCAMTLLVPSGRKHPYRIDEAYLTRHNVEIPGTTPAGHPDPFSISVYRLKQQIHRGWRGDWEAAPASAAKIRLIHLGHVMTDNVPISTYLKPGAWNVVHLTVQPPDITEEEEPKGGSGKNGSRSDPSSGRDRSTRCCVIL